MIIFGVLTTLNMLESLDLPYLETCLSYRMKNTITFKMLFFLVRVLLFGLLIHGLIMLRKIILLLLLILSMLTPRYLA
jgi:hypothetical protein